MPPSLSQYKGSSVDRDLGNAIGGMESGEVVPAVDKDEMEEDKVVVGSQLSDQDRMNRLEEITYLLMYSRDSLRNKVEEMKVNMIECNGGALWKAGFRGWTALKTQSQSKDKDEFSKRIKW